MQLPLTVVFEPPTWAELRRALGTRLIISLGVGLIAISMGTWVAWQLETLPGTSDGVSATLQTSSFPPAAAVQVDGQTRGRTPVILSVAPGHREVILRHSGCIDATYTPSVRPGQVTSLIGDLWLRSPQAQRLRPAYPGISIAGGGFLSDGRVALGVAMLIGGGRQLWLVDNRGGAQRVGPASVSGSLAVSPDGSRVAHLAPGGQGSLPMDDPLAEVWTVGRDGDAAQLHFSLPANAENERLVDVAWAPDSRRLLIVGRGRYPVGGYLTHLLLLGLGDGELKELVSLPAEVVPGSYNWSSDGRRVAFLMRVSQLTSLCLVGVEDGEFSYVADLGQGDAGPPPFAPLAWSADSQQVLYAAPIGDGQASSWLLGTKPAPTLFKGNLGDPMGQRLSKVEGFFPTWGKDGSVVALARSRNGGNLTLQLVDAGGESRQVAELPIKAGGGSSALWDVDHAQGLSVVRSSASLVTPRADYWLVRFRAEVDG